MAKRTNREALEHAYHAIDELHGISALASVNEKVQAIIIQANSIMSSICECADEIKITNFNEVTENYPDLGMPVNLWLELVHLRNLQLHTSLPDEVISKISMQILGGNNITALRESLITSLAKSNELTAPSTSDEKHIQYEADQILDEEFRQLLDDSAKLRHKLDSELWPKLRTYGDAFSYVTGKPWGSFKLLLDIWHYRQGGWPNDKTPPRFWSIVKRFKDAYSELDQYGFDMAKNWCSRFGLDIQTKQVSPTLMNFSDAGEAFGKYFMFKVRDEHMKAYESYGVQPWTHCLASQGRVFIYNWDSREIVAIAMVGDFNLDHIHTAYLDLCIPLTSKVTEYAELAKLYITDIYETEL
jgi:hypothetical protein